MERILRVVVGVGAAAAVILVVAVAVVVIHRNSSANTHVVASPPPRPTVTVGPPAVPATPAAPVAAPPPTTCAASGQQCATALVALLNEARALHSRRPLAYDRVQSHGVPAIHCVGSEGHSRAMASTERIWHSDRRHPHAGYPTDICLTTTASAEVVGVTAGANEWVALQHLEGRFVGPRGRKNRQRLLAGRFRRVGIGIMPRAGRYYVTVDLLR